MTSKMRRENCVNPRVIERLRRERKWSKAELSRRTGFGPEEPHVGPRQIGRIEQRRERTIRVTEKTLMGFARAFKVAPEELFSGDPHHAELRARLASQLRRGRRSVRELSERRSGLDEQIRRRRIELDEVTAQVQAAQAHPRHGDRDRSAGGRHSPVPTRIDGKCGGHRPWAEMVACAAVIVAGAVLLFDPRDENAPAGLTVEMGGFRAFPNTYPPMTPSEFRARIAKHMDGDHAVEIITHADEPALPVLFSLGGHSYTWSLSSYEALGLEAPPWLHDVTSKPARASQPEPI